MKLELKACLLWRDLRLFLPGLQFLQYLIGYTHYACGSINIWEQTNPPVTFFLQDQLGSCILWEAYGLNPSCLNGAGLSTTPDCSSLQKGLRCTPSLGPRCWIPGGNPDSAASSVGPASWVLEVPGAAGQVFQAMLATPTAAFHLCAL